MLTPDWRHEPTDAQPARYVAHHPDLADLLSVYRSADGRWRWWWASTYDTAGGEQEGYAAREEAQEAAWTWWREEQTRRTVAT